MESSLIFLIPAAAMIGAAIIVKAIIDNWTRMRTRGMNPLDPDSDNKIEMSNSYLEMKRHLSNLKWSLILIGVGLPPALSFFFNAPPPEVILGLMLLFAGFGLFIYFLLAKSMLDKIQRNKTKNN
jgi:hypothetical protein